MNNGKACNFRLDEGSRHGTLSPPWGHRSHIPHRTGFVDITSLPKDLRLGSGPDSMRPNHCNQSAIARFQCKYGIPTEMNSRCARSPSTRCWIESTAD